MSFEKNKITKNISFMMLFFALYFALNIGIDLLLGNEITTKKVSLLLLGIGAYFAGFFFWFKFASLNALVAIGAAFIGALFIHQYYGEHYSVYISTVFIPFVGILVFLALGRAMYRTKTRNSWFERG